jgi:restriction system protein
MAIPDFQSFLLPFLRLIGDDLDHRVRDLIAPIADGFGLGAEDRAKMLVSGTQTVVQNRVIWSGVYLNKAGLLTKPSRGFVRITPQGKAVLAAPPAKIDKAFLSQFPSFQEFAFGTKKAVVAAAGIDATASEAVSPDERMEAGWQEIERTLSQELLGKLKDGPWQFFERVVLDLLITMGYGGSREDAGKLIQKAGDEGIDGTISEDRLGLDIIYVQAKRWEGSVGREVVQAFAGSLEGFKARKGVLLTTSKFTAGAQEYVRHLEKRIVLIDGERLVQLMIEHGVGVVTSREYKLRKLDVGYFDEGDEPVA